MHPHLSSLLRASLSVPLFLLAGCPTVDLGELPVSPPPCHPDPVFFEENIWPAFIDTGNPETSCVAQGGCHRLDNGRSAFRVSIAEPIDYSANYGAVTRFLNCGTPSASSLLTKPLRGIESHGGGEMFGDDDPSAQIFLDWFSTP